MVHVHGPSRRLRATFGKITQKQFKKKLCKCSKIRLLSLVNMTMVSNRRTILLKTKNTSVISSNVNRKKYLVVTFKVTLFNYPSPFIPSRKKTAKYIKTWIENC